MVTVVPARVVVSVRSVAGSQPLAAAAFTTGAGLMVCSVANALSRATEAPSPLIYWAGILLIALPIFYRLTSHTASPAERLVLVCLLGLGLYGVKLVRDTPIFTFSDELIHAYNSDEISRHHNLFEANPVLPISAYYPGLESATSALRALTGMSSFGAGAILVGAARLTMMSAMFLVFWRVSGSARIAGLGAGIFTGNFNFLFWSAQYSYESLALPLMMVVLLAVVEVEGLRAALRGSWRLLAAILIGAIVVTHHITSYATVILLAAVSVATVIARKGRKAADNPWPLAVLAVALTTFWLFVVASATVGYLSPVLTDAFHATIDTVAGSQDARPLFQGGDTVTGPTPTLARIVSLFSVVLLAAGLPFGLRTAWRRYRHHPVALVFGASSIAFFGTLALRLAPEAWETGNRASEFLYIGLAFVLACAGLELWRPRRRPWLGRALMSGAMATVLVGGAITGWPWDSQLAQPLRARGAGGGTIESPPLSMAEWARGQAGSGRFAALTADSRLLLSPGERYALTDYYAGTVEIIPPDELPAWGLPLMRSGGVRYVVADQRKVADDGIRGYYFGTEGSPWNALRPRVSVTKFEDEPGVSRAYDGGTIVVYDIGPQREGEEP